MVESEFMKKSRILIFSLISLALLLYLTANFQRIAIPGAIFDLLEQDLSVSAPYITAFGAIFMYVYAIGQLVTGVLVDRFGGIRVIFCGGLILALGCVLFPITSNLLLMYLSRGLIGLGCSMFYLSLIQELKKMYSDRNYGIALSVMLFIGYAGGIAANAPFVAAMRFLSWREILIILSIIVLITVLIFYILMTKTKLPQIDETVTLRFEPFKEVLLQKHNRNLFSFACCNFGICYVIQTTIGKKFLEDFCLMQVPDAAMVLSIMAIVAAFFNIINASVCKLCHNHRVIFLKTASMITFICLLTICLMIFFDIRSWIIGLIFFVIGGNASLSALIIPVIQQSNDRHHAVTAVSIMNFCFFMMVGILGTVTGFILHHFTPERINGVLVYGKDAYLCLFGTFLILSVFEVYKAAKLSNKY